MSYIKENLCSSFGYKRIESKIKSMTYTVVNYTRNTFLTDTYII